MKGALKTTSLLVIGLCLTILAVACGDTEDRRGSSYDKLCLDAADCRNEEVCGPSGTCVTAPRFLEKRLSAETLSEIERDLMATWMEWGTLGAQSSADSQRDNHALCTREDVRVDDLGRRYDASYPVGYWGPNPIADRPGFCGDDSETLAWRLLNCERMSYGLEPLACDQRLVWLGRQHSEDMSKRSFFDHVNPDLRDPFDRMDGRGIDYELAGENLARYESVDAAHRAWMNSEVHRRTLLMPQFSHAGVGIVRIAGQLLMAQELTRAVPSTSRSALRL